MQFANRREFLTGAALAAPAIRTAWAQGSPSDRVRVAVVGFHSKGKEHYQNYAKMPNVQVTALCDPDERLFPAAVAEIQKVGGNTPATETDIRKLLERKDVDAISIASPGYWHALMAIWACQAGKDVYVEKPVSFTVSEGRKMIEAAQKYKRIVAAGQNMRSENGNRAAAEFLKSGKFGKVYRAKVNIVKGRGSIGRATEAPVPPGVHWDLYRGPAPMIPFTYNKFHYGWHFYWDTSTSDMGNSGVHNIDIARWCMNKKTHPTKIQCSGGMYIWDSDQETPNFQVGSFEYEDGTGLDFELTNLYAGRGGGAANIFYTTEGYLANTGGWTATRGKFTPRERKADDPMFDSERAGDASFPRSASTPGPTLEYERGGDNNGHYRHWLNFIECVRSRKTEDLACNIEEGHYSAALCHLANISYRLGRRLTFDPKTEKFVGDAEANKYLTREYRKPFVVPEKV